MTNKTLKLFGVIAVALFFCAITAIFLLRTGEDNDVSVSLSHIKQATVYSVHQGGKININSADAKILQTLPGIGEALSARIIEYRTEHGPFKTNDEIMNVTGVGPKLYEKISPYITTGG